MSGKKIIDGLAQAAAHAAGYRAGAEAMRREAESLSAATADSSQKANFPHDGGSGSTGYEMACEDIRAGIAALPLPEAPASVDVGEVLGTAEEWASKRSELQEWTSSAWLAGEPSEDMRPALYSFLCGLLGYLASAERAAALHDELKEQSHG